MEVETFFIVRALVGSRTFEYGPYMHLSEAAEIFMEHLQDFVQADSGNAPVKYTAQIVEQILLNGHWEDVYVKTQEKR